MFVWCFEDVSGGCQFFLSEYFMVLYPSSPDTSSVWAALVRQLQIGVTRHKKNICIISVCRLLASPILSSYPSFKMHVPLLSICIRNLKVCIIVKVHDWALPQPSFASSHYLSLSLLSLFFHSGLVPFSFFMFDAVNSSIKPTVPYPKLVMFPLIN